MNILYVYICIHLSQSLWVVYNMFDVLFFKFIYFWLCWVFFGVWNFSLVAVHRLLIAVASLIAEHGFQGTLASAVFAQGLSRGSWALKHRLNSCDAQA